jgi:hypothetical protein
MKKRGEEEIDEHKLKKTKKKKERGNENRKKQFLLSISGCKCQVLYNKQD